MPDIKRAEKSQGRAIAGFLRRIWAATFESKFDRATVEKVVTTCFDNDAIGRQIADDAWVFLVAGEDEGPVIGMLNARLEDSAIVVNRLYVDSTSQGRGIGSALLMEITKYFPGADRFVLEVIDNNERAIGFYEHRGFKKTGKNIMAVEDVVLNVFVMEKPIKH